MIKLTPNLRSFLTREKVLDDFITNASNRRYFTRDYYHYTIAGSFNWKKTREGVLFWQTLHAKHEKEVGYKNEYKPWVHMNSK